MCWGDSLTSMAPPPPPEAGSATLLVAAAAALPRLRGDGPSLASHGRLTAPAPSDGADDSVAGAAAVSSAAASSVGMGTDGATGMFESQRASGEAAGRPRTERGGPTSGLRAVQAAPTPASVREGLLFGSRLSRDRSPW